jgi:putative membrane protein
MIIRPRPSPLQLLFVMQGSILPAIATRLLAVLAVSAAVTALDRWQPRILPEATLAPFTLLGLALSIFLGFRNNACYERWWEGRRQWGQLVAETRILVRDLVTLLPERPELRRRCGHRPIAFAHALRNQMRGSDDGQTAAWLPEEERARVAASRSEPDAILLALAEELRAVMRRGALSDIAYKLLSERMAALTGIQTACERLRSTPPPYTYSLLLHRTAWLFCLLLPFGLVGSLGLATPVLAVILAYCFFGLDALGDELEEPFGTRQNALPLDALVRGIEIAALEGLGETALPEPLSPRGGILL